MPASKKTTYFILLTASSTAQLITWEHINQFHRKPRKDEEKKQKRVFWYVWNLHTIHQKCDCMRFLVYAESQQIWLQTVKSQDSLPLSVTQVRRRKGDCISHAKVRQTALWEREGIFVFPYWCFMTIWMLRDFIRLILEETNSELRRITKPPQIPHLPEHHLCFITYWPWK